MIRERQLPGDPFEGRAERRRERRLLVEGAVAFVLSVAACGITAAAWLQILAPLVTRFGLG